MWWFYPILEILLRRGLRELYELGLRSGFVPRRKGYVSPCHLCLDLRLHLYFHEKAYDELYPAFFYEELQSI